VISAQVLWVAFIGLLCRGYIVLPGSASGPRWRHNLLTEAVGYAAFSRRHDVDSPTGASAGPILVLADVTDVRVEARSGVAFRTEPAGAAIPPTAPVAHPRTVPLSVHDGQVVDQFPAARGGATFGVRAGLNLAEHRVRVFLDPGAGPDGLTPVRLRHPEAEGARA
jgi:hypothetical protein